MQKISSNFKEMFWIYWYEKDDPEKVRREWQEVIVDEFDSEGNAIKFEAYGRLDAGVEGVLTCSINP